MEKTFFKMTFILGVILPPLTSYAKTADCKGRGPLEVPKRNDILSLKKSLEYENSTKKGTVFNAVVTSKVREIACGLKTPNKNIKCYSKISLMGTAMVGQRLKIPQGALINVSRINYRNHEIYLYPRQSEGLQSTRSGTFKIKCVKFEAVSLPGKSPIYSNFKDVDCFNGDMNLLFANTSLNACKKSNLKKTSQTDRKNSRSDNLNQFESDDSSIE